jgi:dTDP-4-amino-4,6-dideoxygalactose transaminase
VKEKIWLSAPHMSGHEIKFVEDAFASNWVAPLGPYVNAFEKDLSTFTSAKHVVALGTGTAAIHLALVVLGVDMNDVVICATGTFAASANPIIYQRATPVFVDADRKNWNMSPYWLEKAVQDSIEKGKRPKAIIAVHLYGVPANMKEIMAIADKYHIPVIEDAAEALGSTYRGQHVGLLGSMGTLSFNGNKIITTSGGGALFTNTKSYADKVRYLSDQARDAVPHYQHNQLGYNCRLSNICAAIGCGQMQVLNRRIQQRRWIFEFYREKLAHLPGIEFQAELPHSVSNRWLTCITVDPETSGGIDKDQLLNAFRDENIDSRPVFKPMHLQPIYRKYPFFGDGTFETLFDRGLCLPSGSNLAVHDLMRVIEVIHKCYADHSTVRHSEPSLSIALTEK